MASLIVLDSTRSCGNYVYYLCTLDGQVQDTGEGVCFSQDCLQLHNMML